MTTGSSFGDAVELRVGRLTVVALTDGLFRVPSFFFKDPEALESLDSSSDPPELPIGAFLIPGDEPVLIDAGIGPVDFGGTGNLVGGRLLDELRTAGFDPEDIAIVALTHLHPDHVGWIGTPSGEPVFPRARVIIGRRDWEQFVENEEDRSLDVEPHIRAALRSMYDAGQVELTDGELSVTTSLTAVPAPGHTPGHQVFAVQDGTEKLLILGDAAYCAAQLTHADWDVFSDFDPAQARATRRLLLAETERADVDAVGCHFQHFNSTRALVP